VISITYQEYLTNHNSVPVIDVRSEFEFSKGHIPQAKNIPLLTDEQRKEVGRVYKNKSKQNAVVLGIKLIGPNLEKLVLEYIAESSKNQIILYCHRGGMRSQSVAWLCEQCGLEVLILDGGYKAYRTWVIETSKKKLNIVLICGKTGVGKTQLLQELNQLGEQIIDLESLVNHKGSAFGGIGQHDQPSNAQFENDLAFIAYELEIQRTVWLESESRMIGRCVIPQWFWVQMLRAPFVLILRDKKSRLTRLCIDYQHATVSDIERALEKIAKRLGSQAFDQALLELKEGNREEVVTLALQYYDRRYSKSQGKREGRLLFQYDILEKHVSRVAQDLQSSVAKLLLQ
jgi:tRNA 2-selenouridine synthase